MENKQYTYHKFEAYLGTHLSFDNYMQSYQNAFNILFEYIEGSNSRVDIVSYPLLFMARHAVEIGLKLNIKYFSKYSKKADYVNSNSHVLSNLYQGFQFQVKETIKKLKEDGADISKETIDELYHYFDKSNCLISTIETLDKFSCSFRYPIDNKNNRNFDYNDSINLIKVKELFEDTMILLSYIRNVFFDYTDIIDEIETEYEQTLYSEI
jgi:hypothetical protein